MVQYDKDPTILCKTFVEKANAILSEHSEIQHTFSIDDGYEGCILDIPQQSENGFNITIEIDENRLILYTEGSHIHLDDVQDPKHLVQDILGLLRDLLSSAMRVVEFLSDDKPYKWSMESFRNGKWENENTTGLLFYNYFGKKTQKIYQNDILPSREL